MSKIKIRGVFLNIWPGKRLARRTAVYVGRAVCGIEPLESRVLFSPIVVNTLSDPSTLTTGTLSLRQAITQANDNHGGTITFASGLSGTITLTQSPAAPLRLSDSTVSPILIQGPGSNVLAVSGDGETTVFQIEPLGLTPVTATITGLTIEDGNAGSSDGGGIDKAGVLAMGHSDVTNNVAYIHGGGDASTGIVIRFGHRQREKVLKLHMDFSRNRKAA
jgi:hypothetical protein